MPGKRKRSSNYADDEEDLSGKGSASQGTMANSKRVRSTRLSRTRKPVDSNETSPEAPNAALQEVLKDGSPARQSPRRTRRSNLKVEVEVPTPGKRGKRASQTVTQETTSHCTVDQASPRLPSLLGKPPPPADSSTAAPSTSSHQAESSLSAQKRAIMRALQSSEKLGAGNDASVNDTAARQLAELLDGTVTRAEGNSCLILGPRSSGKSKMVESCLSKLSTEPITLRLSGWIQTSDRHALREIAFQLLQQTGSSFLTDMEVSQTGDSHEEGNPFLVAKEVASSFDSSTLSLPPSSHLHSLIPALVTLKRPVVVILDSFDLFALHPRQSLLYCLLDTVQNCRASAESRGIAVIGITSRVDTIQLLEKRVKSRFSGRTIRTAPSGSFEAYLTFVKNSLTARACGQDHVSDVEWSQRWKSSIEIFLSDREVLESLKETFGLSKDFKLISRILMACVLQLKSDHPHLSYKHLATAIEAQRSRSSYTCITNLSYPATCLLIASVHAYTSGHPTFTFEMLFDNFREQVRSSSSAPVQVKGGSIGMVRCSREVLTSAFESLTAAKIFVPVVGSSTAASKVFMKHRCALEREVVKDIVERSGQVNLRKWLNKAS